jgi:A/G-specific adenine glycosylase
MFFCFFCANDFFIKYFQFMSRGFGQVLTDWFAANKRDLPWRHTRDPYKIWLSEIILQQTRVNQGLAYYLRFIEHFPEVKDLAAASREKIYRLWQGLGYYNRADNLMKAAKVVVQDFGEQFPTDYETLKTLPGIGDYTAAAIASFAFDEKTPVVDGNVYRFLSRLYGISTPIHTGKAKKEFTALAASLMNGQPPADFNQALMEFGALHCVPNNPDCQQCVFNTTCTAFSQGKVMDYPVKKPKTAVRDRYIYYFVIQEKETERLILNKRSSRDIWRNLYDFPSVTRDNALHDPLDALPLAEKEGWFTAAHSRVGSPSPVYIHKLTHLTIHAIFIPVISNEPLSPEGKFLSLVSLSEIVNYPVPQLIVRYFRDQGIRY